MMSMYFVPSSAASLAALRDVDHCGDEAASKARNVIARA
jgi:hypothetical protein